MNLLAADIGGTKTILQLARVEQGQLQVIDEQKYPSADFPQFDKMLQCFLAHHAANTPIQAACFGLAGPIEGQHAKVTNLPWTLHADNLNAAFNIAHTQLLNDFAAIAYAVPTLEQQDLHTLQVGKPQAKAPIAILGAGTGLGVALLSWCGQRYQVIATEAGHSHFAPTNALQIQLLQYLLRKYARVSNERLISGMGIVNIFDFLRDTRTAPINTKLHQRLQDGERAQCIAEFAANGTDETAVSCLQTFAEIYAQFAGDLALSCLAQGGVYLAGGIAAKNRPFLQQNACLRAFNNKGRMTQLVTAMPVHIILNPRVGVIGAMQVAHLLAAEAVGNNAGSGIRKFT